MLFLEEVRDRPLTRSGACFARTLRVTHDDMDASMPPNRRPSENGQPYPDACRATHAMDIVGQRWAIPVMRELMLGPRRFSDLENHVYGISERALANRLAALEAAGVVVRGAQTLGASEEIYELTEWGYAAEPILWMLGGWAMRSPLHDPTRPLSAASLLLSMKVMLDREAAAPLTGIIRMKLNGEDYFAELDRGDIEVGRGRPDKVRVTITGEPAILAGWLFGSGDDETLAAADKLAVEGDLAFAMRFADCFEVPEKAPLPSDDETLLP